MKETEIDLVVDAILDSAPSESAEDIYNAAKKEKVETLEEAKFLLAGIQTMMEHQDVMGVLKGTGSNGRRM